MTDYLLQIWVSLLVQKAKLSWALGHGRRWKPGEPLRLLFAGYNGTRNTGSDVRVEELLRQVRTVLGADRVRLTVMTQDFDATRGYFGDAAQVRLPNVFPPFLAREVPRHDGVIACEGSMFKSKFANALSAMMAGSLGIAAAQNRLSLGYGAEAGAMDASLRRLVRRTCNQSTVITRNEESQAVLRRMGIASLPGTDTAWTFRPKPTEEGRALLRSAGWNGRAPVLALCAIHPFWWPVKPSLLKSAACSLFGAYSGSHFRSLYFHRSGRDVERRFERYLRSLAGAARSFRERQGAFVVCVAMERLDAVACARLSDLLGGAPVLPSDRHDMHSMVSMLRACDAVVSSRYHALVTSMPGLVPSAGVTMDERIANLMKERGHASLLFRVDDEDLEPRLEAALETLRTERDSIAAGIGATVAENLRKMAGMGLELAKLVRRTYPEFELPEHPGGLERYLPPLAPELEQLLEVHAPA